MTMSLVGTTYTICILTIQNQQPSTNNQNFTGVYDQRRNTILPTKNNLQATQYTREGCFAYPSSTQPLKGEKKTYQQFSCQASISLTIGYCTPPDFSQELNSTSNHLWSEAEQSQFPNNLFVTKRSPLKSSSC
eukprot:TRINITY_DN5519_c0_g1_i7.p1 TRINITY_DN5519_c0_g1~~TRINITY_DN5519_c0_g1_i7.p1  ORF type:complete len:133 (+),score=0.12 TRINITY_DN5519_c0_g1_i7:14-412(+)